MGPYSFDQDLITWPQSNIKLGLIKVQYLPTSDDKDGHYEIIDPITGQRLRRTPIVRFTIKAGRSGHSGDRPERSFQG